MGVGVSAGPGPLANAPLRCSRPAGVEGWARPWHGWARRVLPGAGTGSRSVEVCLRDPGLLPARGPPPCPRPRPRPLTCGQQVPRVPAQPGPAAFARCFMREGAAPAARGQSRPAAAAALSLLLSRRRAPPRAPRLPAGGAGRGGGRDRAWWPRGGAGRAGPRGGAARARPDPGAGRGVAGGRCVGGVAGVGARCAGGAGGGAARGRGQFLPAALLSSRRCRHHMATAMALRAHGLWGRLSPRVVLGRWVRGCRGGGAGCPPRRPP